MTDPCPASRRLRIRVCGGTDRGRQRENNEDSFLIADLDASTVLSPGQAAARELGGRGMLLVVADGLGGANAGEVASAMAVELIHDQVAVHGDGTMGPLVDAVKFSNAVIKTRGTGDSPRRGMASTCVVAGIVDGRALLCNVGDSRGYLLRASRATQLTHDQSFVQYMLDVGAVKPEDAASIPHRHVVTEALGAREDVNVAMAPPVALEPGDAVILCSDGLYGHVDGDDIARVLGSSADPAEHCRNLIDLANERGGRDNITVIVAAVDTVETPGEPVGSPEPERMPPGFAPGFLVGLLVGALLTLLVWRGAQRASFSYGRPNAAGGEARPMNPARITTVTT